MSLFVYDDNFLTEEEIQEFENIYFSQDLSWLYHKSTQGDDINHIGVIDTGAEDIPSFSLSPDPIKDHEVYLLTANMIKKFTNKHDILFKDIMLIKFNATPCSPVEKTIYPHVDLECPHYVFLYYVNDSDGDTFLYNETKSNIKLTEATIMKRITPKRGSAFVIDGAHYHSLSPPTKNYFRFVVNANLSI
jgi:hypothetical protein